MTLEELLEARELLEVPAARLAAAVGATDDLERLRATIPAIRLELDTQEEFAHNARLPPVVIESLRQHAAQRRRAAGLLRAADEPRALRARPRASTARSTRTIVRIAGGDRGGRRATRPSAEMRDHLEFLRPYYEKAWRHAVTAAERG